jgi:hypothetical protein
MARLTTSKRNTDTKISVSKDEFALFRKWQTEVADALGKIKRGREEYRKSTTTIAPSPRVFR